MELTEEQKERIRRNRERALELQKQRKQEKDNNNNSVAIVANVTTTTNSTIKRGLDECNVQEDNDDEINKKRRNDSEIKGLHVIGNNKVDNKDDDNDEIEAFEEGASEYVTKQEAMKVYCLPQGTLDVCQYIERTNPKNKTWTTMKLYYRKEIRRRAHERYGNISGLIQERNQRSQNKLYKDIEKSKNIFK